jgi:prepilin-type N-terminal cleavage/methylation domain-containing protein
MSRNRLGLRLARAARANNGFTLIELMWVMVLSLVVFGAVMSVLIASLHQTTENLGHVSANDAVTRTLERVTRKLREATYVSVPSSDGTKITLHEYVSSTGSQPATLHTINWDCSGQDSSGHHSCTRQDLTAGTTATEITDLVVANVFRPGTLPSGSTGRYAPIQAWLEQSILGSSDLTLSEQVTPRNCLYGSLCDNG